MIIKNAAIEIGRRNKEAVIVGVHPGIVDSPLSKIFQASIPKDQLFTPDFAVEQMLQSFTVLSPKQSGTCINYDGTQLAW